MALGRYLIVWYLDPQGLGATEVPQVCRQNSGRLGDFSRLWQFTISIIDYESHVFCRFSI